MNHKHPFIFSGVSTALITPFKDGGIDRPALRRIATAQVEAGIASLIVCGTTGEAATLREVERDLVLSEVLETVGGRVPVIVGCGTNDTAQTVSLIKRAEALGADGLLLVTPYYNKGTRAGIRRHFLTAAEATHLPIILYNVPSRTGVSLTLADYAALDEHPSVVGIKEASSDIEHAALLCRMLGERTAVYAGNDSAFLPFLSLGACGIVSVVSNLFPREMVQIYSLYTSGSREESRRLFFRLLPMIRLLFEDTNPAPVKYAMAQMGYGNGEVRLPLAPIEVGLRERIGREMAVLSETAE